MSSEEVNKYKHLENQIVNINRIISFSDTVRKRNNEKVLKVVSLFENELKNVDELFAFMYKRVFYGGSYYDGLKIDDADEYDLDMLLNPKNEILEVVDSTIPAFMQILVHMDKAELRMPKSVYGKFVKLVETAKSVSYLSVAKVNAWMEGITTKALNNIRLKENIEMYIHKSGPAKTIKITYDGVKIDIDLVPCFLFTESSWPKGSYRKNPYSTDPNTSEFFVVPKAPKVTNLPDNVKQRYWRLSFQQQERVMINGRNTLKQVNKLLKKLRNTQNYKCIASYFIKTVIMHELDARPSSFWNERASYVLMEMLKTFANCLKSGSIFYYWNKKANLLEDLNVKEFGNAVQRIISKIDNHSVSNPDLIYDYFLTAQEKIEMNISESAGVFKFDMMKSIQQPNSIAKSSFGRHRNIGFPTISDDSDSDYYEETPRPNYNNSRSVVVQEEGLSLGQKAAIIGGIAAVGIGLLSLFATNANRNNNG